MKINCFLILAVSAVFMLPSAFAQTLTPPVARKEHKTTIKHGTELVDSYAWLKKRGDNEVISYLESENDYAKGIMKDTEPLQKRLFEEMKSRIKETDLSVPQKIDNYYYYSRTEKGKQYSIHCRRLVAEGAKEEIIFDENKYAENQPYFALGALKISPNHKMLAYSIDNSGAENFELKVLNLETKQTLADTIASTTYGVVWAEDNETIFYTLRDKTGRAYLIKRHKIGTDTHKDPIIYEEKNGQFWAGIGKTRDKKFLLIASSSSTSSEYKILEANNPTGEFKMFRAREKNIEYGLVHQNDCFYIATNEGAVNFKVMRCKDTDFSPDKWQEFIAPRKNVLIDDIEAFEDYLVVCERENGLQKIRYYNRKTGEFKTLPFAEATYSITVGGNPEYKTTKFRYNYTSLTTPNSVFDFDMASGKSELKKQTEVLGGFNKDDYFAERIYAKAPDNTMVPISLVYNKKLKSKAPSKLYLTAYGSYGSSFDPYFSSVRLSLLDRGFIYAIAHIRGGEEMGRPWYDDGKLLKKKNTFTDFIACAEHLIKQGYTSKNLLAINGGSAGGLLMGAVANMRPDLFKVIVSNVPFVDMMNTMLDPSLPLVKEEYEEWGDPNVKEYFDYMLSYSPYDNVKEQAYPAMLITGSLNDPRVSYWEPAKLVAKLRDKKTDDNILLLKTNMEAGHGGASGRYDYLKEIAFEYAFIFKVLKMPLAAD